MAQDLVGLLGLAMWHRRNLCTLLGGGTPLASPRSAGLYRSAEGILCRFGSLQRLRQGKPRCQSAAPSQHFQPASFASKNLPLSLSLQDVHSSWVSLWVSSSNNQKETQSKACLGPFEFQLASTWKNDPSVLLKYCPGSHAIQLKSSSAVLIGLPIPWKGPWTFLWSLVI